jgi:hypothetical protein
MKIATYYQPIYEMDTELSEEEFTEEEVARYNKRAFGPELSDDIRIHTSEEDNSELKRMYEQQLYNMWIKEDGDGGKTVVEEDDGYCD